MTLDKPTIVIFDMDGTTVRHINPRILEIMEWLDDHAYNLGEFFGRFFSSKKNKIPRSRLKYSPKIIVHRTLHRLRRKSVEQIVEPCPGVQLLLDWLLKERIPVGLVSNGLGRGYGHDILQKFEFDRYFKATLFAEDINSSKPDPAPILQMISLLAPKPNAQDIIWYIGDRHKDIKAAINAQKQASAKIIPMAYGLFGSACLAAIENNLPSEQIIASYPDLMEKIV